MPVSRDTDRGGSITRVTLTEKTDHDLLIDRSFAEPAPARLVEAAARALRDNGHEVLVVDDPDAARETVAGLLPTDRAIFTATSQTLRESGIAALVDEGTAFRSVRADLADTPDPAARRRLGQAPDVVVGSVHAVTTDGRLVIASATGSQLGPYAAGAGRVIWVVGAQKVVTGLDTALRRVETYAYPREDERARTAYNSPSSLSKILLVNREGTEGRTTVVLVRTAIGF